ncbi:MAG: VWA-like domain-containing protein [Lachnospiraceae bacterium]|nr:VWA-like domain-containing protein [Lachnospiraceae bacterium]MDD7378707.1 VWA-like domain-containing protein [Lachnospiraceae bacterium]MDY4618104.1 VWA-like domain-containing protein [Lachnospiraceae bacterium]
MFEEELLEKAAVCEEILQDARAELYMNMRFLDVALYSLKLQPTAELSGCGTDGVSFFYQIPYLIEQYRIGNVPVNRMYLHSVFHCLFGHVWEQGWEEKPQIPEGLDDWTAQAWEESQRQQSRQIWDLACDIAMESVIDSLMLRCVRCPSKPYRKAVYDGFREKLPVLTAQGIYRVLKQADLDIRIIARMIQEFRVDDHSRWEKSDRQNSSPQGKNQRDKWKDIREKTETDMQTFSKEAADGSKGLLEQLSVENRERYDYRSFLKKFCVLKEEMQVDMDSFDYIFYNYGMELYGNMPLIEPQETKEVHRIEDFVIAIDTSMSCKKELVQKFLEETYSILSQSESFYRRFRIHIIQCDEKVQSDDVITDAKELEQYMKNFQLRGMGGTDFRPVFSYVNRLQKEKKFHRLRGLIYFTDGYGTFPLKKPLYDTAFIFLKEDYLDVDVPPWAIKLILDESQLGQAVE